MIAYNELFGDEIIDDGVVVVMCEPSQSYVLHKSRAKKINKIFPPNIRLIETNELSTDMFTFEDNPLLNSRRVKAL
jgi:hypothetical protein